MPVILLLAAFIWTVPAVKFQWTLEKKGYTMFPGIMLLFLSGVIGIAAFFGQPVMRVWMIKVTLAAPFLLWAGAAFMPLAPVKPGTSGVKEESVVPLGFAIVWGLWLTYCGVVLLIATASRKSTESANAGLLRGLNTRLSIYRSDSQRYPATLKELLPKYVDTIPRLHAIADENRILHGSSTRVEVFTSLQPNDKGGWGYVSAPGGGEGKINPEDGRLFINCTHATLGGGQKMYEVQ